MAGKASQAVAEGGKAGESPIRSPGASGRGKARKKKKEKNKLKRKL
jgi:hypothetical protein